MTWPAVTRVVSSASFQPGIAPGYLITIFGTNLSSTTDTWANAIVGGNLPVLLDSVSVNIGGKPAYIAYVSPTQINVVAPNVGLGDVEVTVTAQNGTSLPNSATVRVAQPSFFQCGSYAVATHLDFTLAARNGTFSNLPTVPVKPGEVVIFWGTGFGPTSPPAPVGGEVPSEAIYYPVDTVTAAVGAYPRQSTAQPLPLGMPGSIKWPCRFQPRCRTETTPLRRPSSASSRLRPRSSPSRSE